MVEGLLAQVRQMVEPLGVRAVFGEPIHAHGRTLVPVAKVTGGLGFGVGSRQRHEDEEGEHERSHGEGGGAGVGVVARPVAVVEIREDRTRVLPVWDANRLVLAAFALLAWGVFWLARSFRAR